MFAIIALFFTIMCAAMTGLTIEAKAKGWWVWLLLTCFWLVTFMLQIQS